MPIPTVRKRREQATVQETKMFVRTSKLVESEKESVLEVRKFETDPAYVRVNVGVTRNMGNYESLRLDISINAPCYIEEIENVAKALSDRVSTLLDEELEKYTDGTSLNDSDK